MSIKTLYKTVNSNGEYSCGDIGITTEDWYDILKAPKAEQYIECLLAFLREPEHKATCTKVSENHQKPAQYYNSKVTNFSRWVQKYLNRFRVEGTDGNETYWCIAMQKGWDTKQGFQWQLREELVEALRRYLMDDLIDHFRNGKPFNGYNELYKWELIDSCDGMDSIDIYRSLYGKNVVDCIRINDVIKYIGTVKTSEGKVIIDHLLDESKPLNSRLEDFKSEMRDFIPDRFKTCGNDERTAASILTCKYPENYTFYMDKVYKNLWKYFGFEHFEAGKKYSHFLQIINNFTVDYGNEIQDIIAEYINDYNHKPLILSVQTLFWCMKEYMEEKLNKDMRFTWIPFYKEFAEKIMHYRNDRKSLLDIIYANDDSLIVNYLHDNKGEGDLCKDIDPFTTLGIFNRGITEDNRKVGAEKFKELLSIEAEAPSDFTGIPILNNQMSHFFGFRNKREKDDIENLWKLFEKVVRGEDFKSEYDTVIRQYIINVNITMGLFWIRPEEYLALDKTNNTYMKDEYGIDLPKKVPSYDDYMSLLQMIKEKMATNEIKENTFYEISANAAGAMDSIDNEGTWYDDIVETWKKRKNIVLYGAPGTGKTYDVPEFVVRLCQPEFDANNAEREDLMKVYNQLKQEKRVAFTTFHQSMDYEDWMEGLKPVVDNNQVTYEIDRGIFKILCEEAERPIVKNKQIGIASDAVVWKVSLQGTGDNPVRKECMDNGHIRIGWDDYGAVISDETDWTKHNGEGKQILDAFINKMKEGDIIMSCYTNRTIDAIGVVVGDYEFDNSYDHYKRVRKVNWLLKDINENIVEMNNGKTMTLGTVYRLNAITLDKVKALLDKHKTSASMEDNTKPYVMVIDELNRGNVSKIFGELITLLEADKRKGHKNAESVILPYSKVQFMVPDNVYIIATMNTADRSLGNLDYAIRRRFAFIADKPYSLEGEVPGFNEELFHKVSDLFITNYDEYKDSGWLQTLPLKPADTLSEEYKPEDVWIGHSYFIMKDEDGTDITTDRLLYEIIPLFEEYVRDGVLTEDVYSIIEELRNIANE